MDRSITLNFFEDDETDIYIELIYIEHTVDMIANSVNCECIKGGKFFMTFTTFVFFIDSNILY